MNNDYGTRTQNQATAFPLSPSELSGRVWFWQWKDCSLKTTANFLVYSAHKAEINRGQTSANKHESLELKIKIPSLQGLSLLPNTSAFTHQTLLLGRHPLTGNEEAKSNKVKIGKCVKLDKYLSSQLIYPLASFSKCPNILQCARYTSSMREGKDKV